jgi:hypothetical protein
MGVGTDGGFGPGEQEDTTMAAATTTGTTTEKVKGPASYFPSIEARYGKPIGDWLEMARGQIASGEKHMAVVTWLKAEHGMGHGHANAVVGYVRQAG